MDAVGLKDLRTHGPEADRLWKVLQRETLGVPEAVLGLNKVLGDRNVWHVAVIAGRNGVMTGLLPTVVLVSHNVTVDARLRVVAQVRESFGVVDSEAPRAEHDAG